MKRFLSKINVGAVLFGVLLLGIIIAIVGISFYRNGVKKAVKERIDAFLADEATCEIYALNNEVSEDEFAEYAGKILNSYYTGSANNDALTDYVKAPKTFYASLKTFKRVFTDDSYTGFYPEDIKYTFNSDGTLSVEVTVYDLNQTSQLIESGAYQNRDFYFEMKAENGKWMVNFWRCGSASSDYYILD